MVGGIFVYADTVFGFYGYFLCLVGCVSMIMWTPAVLSVLYACFVRLYLHLFSATEYVSHGKALWKYAHYYYYVNI